MPLPPPTMRVDWVDCAKGITIILVVMMHSTLGVESALGTTAIMGSVIEFARTFRMPLFFVIAGLFLSRTITKPLAEFLDKKVLHFAYFYVLWSVIQIGLKITLGGGTHSVGLTELFLIPIQPFGTIWFIYVLPLFFVVTRLLNALPWATVLALSLILNVLPIHTGWIAIDAFAHYFIFFLTGYHGAPKLFEFANTIASKPFAIFGGVFLFSFANGLAIKFGLQDLPVLATLLSFAGVATLISLCTQLPGTRAGSLFRYCGARSLYIYVAFFLPMAASRIIAIKLGLISDADLLALSVTVLAVVGTLIMYELAKRTPARFLYKRPSFLKLNMSGPGMPHVQGTVATR